MSLLAILGIVNKLYAQDTLLHKVPKPKKNAFEVHALLHDFFDRNPIVQTKSIGAIGWTNLSYGLGYTRHWKAHGIEATARAFHIQYYEVLRGPKPPGWVYGRYGYIFELLYTYRFAEIKRMEFRALLGANFRYGDEHQVVSYGPLDILPEFYELRDPGITGGLRGVQLLPWNFQVSGELKYTFYVYRHTKPRDYMRQYTDGTTRHMLTMQLGIGYRF